MNSPSTSTRRKEPTRSGSPMCPLKIFPYLLLVSALHFWDQGAEASTLHKRLSGLVESMTKSASLGGQQVLNCHVSLPVGKKKPHVIQWNKAGLDQPVYMRYDNYPPQINGRFEGRLKIIHGMSLEISHIRTQDEGWYECKVIFLDIEKFTGNGTWVYLKVNIPPRIVACSPKSLHHRQGESVELFCNASGSPEPALIWNKDGKPLQASSRIQIDGYKVIIRNVQRSDAGVYMGTFTNSVGSVSQLINLVVEGAAYILIPPENMTAIEGQRIKFQCGAMAYPNNITYNWFKDSENIKFLPDYGKRVNAFKDGSLVITSVVKNDMGWYTCHPTNGIGEDPKASAYLNVTYLPKMLKMLHRIYWALGHQQSLVCNVDANPPIIKTQWTKNGRTLQFNSDRLQLLANGTVVVSRVQNSDAGSYSCQASSSLGRGPSSLLVQVIVRDPPYFTIRPKPIYQSVAGNSITIPCDAEGTPKPEITWRKVDGEIDWESRASQNKGNLTIYLLEKADHGDYECVATNQITSIVIGTKLLIETPKTETTPHAPYNVTVTTSLFTAKVQWMPAYNGGLEQNYVIWFRNTDALESNWQTIRVPPGDKTSFIVYSLEADTLYEFMVLSRNIMGNGLYSDRVLARTLGTSSNVTLVFVGYHSDLPTSLPTKPNGATYIPPVVRPIGPRPKAPLNVTIKVHRGAVNVTWFAPQNSNVSIFYYVVEYCNDSVWHRVDEVVLTPKSWYMMRDLKPGTYKFRVFSFSLLSYSQPQESEQVVVPEGPDNDNDGTDDSDNSLSALPVPAIGGIVGGLAFLLIAVILAIIAVIISKRKQKKKAKKYGNVKYFEPDQVDSSRNETSSEWNYGDQDGRRNIVKAVNPMGMLNQTFVMSCHSPSDILKCNPVAQPLPSKRHLPPSSLRPYIFQDQQKSVQRSALPKSTSLNNGAKTQQQDTKLANVRPPNKLVQQCPDTDIVTSLRQQQLSSPGPMSPIGHGIACTSVHRSNVYNPVSPCLLQSHSPVNLHITRAQIHRPNGVSVPDNTQKYKHASSIVVSTTTLTLDSGHSPGTNTLRNHMTSPVWTRTSPGMSAAPAAAAAIYHHAQHLKSSSSIASLKSCYAHSSIFSPNSQHHSMNKTYLTSSPDDANSLRPFQISDISSVQPSSFSERSRDQDLPQSLFSSPQGSFLPSSLSENEPVYLKRHLKENQQLTYSGTVPFKTRSIHPQQRNSSAYFHTGQGPNYYQPQPQPQFHLDNVRKNFSNPHQLQTQAAAVATHNHNFVPHVSYTHSHSLYNNSEGGECKDNNNQLFGYSNNCQEMVKCGQLAPKHQLNSNCTLAVNQPHQMSPIPSQTNSTFRQKEFDPYNCIENIPHTNSTYPAKDQPSDYSTTMPCYRNKTPNIDTVLSHHFDGGVPEEIRTSMSSSGRGSIFGRVNYPDGISRTSSKMDTFPDSYSSGLGSHHSGPSSSFYTHTRAAAPMDSTSASSLTSPQDYDVSLDSSLIIDASNSNRRDFSGDEHYDFDSTLISHNAPGIVECKLDERHSTRREPSTRSTASPPEILLNANDLYKSLYPKPRKPSRYSNSEKRFERLREEYYEYRRKQLTHLQQQYFKSMDSEML
ncbi:uncharacterized protein LOC115211947 isoform X2 [Octopus sinensis]|uniref:Uncharacterized protein LOC115211947 isoform X2 n=1 Tax=Octopus sinensis TaxID=2607531 RepID=A0A7E6EV55_9MOLL|nr:uncharacterized protein LOC115211947 isoform X2 [Octopus sinensis]